MKSFLPANILLPDFDKVNGTKWAVVACDQYTSEPEYWSKVDAIAGSSPSTLHITLPEVYLDETEKRVPLINAEMEKYLKDVLINSREGFIYLERTQANGKIRRGLIGMVDLDEYDFNRGSSSLIRATEGTVLSRIPPRVKIRKDAPVELPHVLMLIDDPDKTVIEPLTAIKEGMEKAYDFDLMLDGGHVTAYYVDKKEEDRISCALEALITPEAMEKKYGGCFAPLLFAVGDGNHSLATAKTCYEELKETIGTENAAKTPAKYALVELENLHDDTLEFEPIYRVVFGVNIYDIKKSLCAYAKALSGNESAQKVIAVTKEGDEEIIFEKPMAQLTVGTLQSFLDEYIKDHKEAEIDYIHGEESLRKLATKENTIGFLFDGMTKDQLFKTVICDGALPRKTFSMGHANDKRYYLECRKIK